MSIDLIVGIAFCVIGFAASAILIRRDVVRQRRVRDSIDDWLSS